MEIKDSRNYFYARDGTVLKSMEDMLGLLRVIDDSSLSHHFNDEKNDFLMWTKEILKDKVLSRTLEKAKTRDEMIMAIEKRLKTKSSSRKKIISQIKEAVANG